jgi:hypothetical protein
MNKLQEKATELIALAGSCGIETITQTRGNYAVDIEYKVRKGRLISTITYTETGRVSIATWESYPAFSNRVSLKNLGDYLKAHARDMAEHAERIGA